MTTPVARQPDTGLESNYLAKVPVTRSHGLRMVNNLSYLLGFVGAQPIHAGYLKVNSFLGTISDIPIRYNRTPGIQALLIEFELYGETDNATGTLSVAVSAGSISWIVPGKLGVATAIPAVYAAQPRSTIVRERAVMDVTGITPGTSVELAFSFASLSGPSYGIRYLQVTEVPLPATDPQGAPTTESGLDAGWPAHNNRLIQGSSSVGRGFKRYIAQLLKAKTESRRHFQIVGHDDTIIGPWSDAVGGTWINPFGGTFRIRARRLYSTAVTNRHSFENTYRTSDGSTTASFRISDGTSTTTITGAAAAVTRAMTSAIMNVVTNGTDQEATLTVEFKKESGPGTVFWLGWAMIEAEV